MSSSMSVRLSALFSADSSAVVAEPALQGELRRADRFTELAVLAADGVIKSAGRERVGLSSGVLLGTVGGPLETNFRFLDDLLDDGEGRASPTFFSHSVHNAAAGYIARIYGLSGPVCTVTKRTWPFLEAVRTACVMIQAGRMERAVVVGVEQHSPLMHDAMKALLPCSAREDFTEPLAGHGAEGAVAWLLESCQGGNRDNLLLGDVTLYERSCDAPFFLFRTEEAWAGEYEGVPVKGWADIGSGYAIESIIALTAFADSILTGRIEGEVWKWMVTARFGMASVEFVRKRDVSGNME